LPPFLLRRLLLLLLRLLPPRGSMGGRDLPLDLPPASSSPPSSKEKSSAAAAQSATTRSNAWPSTLAGKRVDANEVMWSMAGWMLSGRDSGMLAAALSRPAGESWPAAAAAPREEEAKEGGGGEAGGSSAPPDHGATLPVLRLLSLRSSAAAPTVRRVWLCRSPGAGEADSVGRTTVPAAAAPRVFLSGDLCCCC
jgi:hypothetical protein